MKNVCPCFKDGKHCDKRTVGCHSKCKDYKEWRQEQDEHAAKVRKVRNEQRQLDDAIFDRYRYSKNKKGRRNYK